MNLFKAWLRSHADPRLQAENEAQALRIGELMYENSRLTDETERLERDLAYALDLLGTDKSDFTARGMRTGAAP